MVGDRQRQKVTETIERIGGKSVAVSIGGLVLSVIAVVLAVVALVVKVRA